MIVPLERLTDELPREPETPYEIIDGEIVEKPMSSYDNVMGGDLHTFISNYSREHGLGRGVIEVLFDFPNLTNNRRPDVAFVSYSRWPKNRRVPRVNAWPVVPELAVEVISPFDYMNDVLEKVAEYFSAGVTLVWLVLPLQEQVYVYKSRSDVRIVNRSEELTGEPVLPGFRLPLSDLFPPPDDPAA
jgi:Uma2 family endonuclease